MKLLLDKAAALQVQASKMAQEHQEEEDVLRKKKCKAATEVAAVVDKYDGDMAALETEIQDVEHTLETERVTCQELHEHFIKVLPWCSGDAGRRGWRSQLVTRIA
jgi:hypothetical protein